MERKTFIRNISVLSAYPFIKPYIKMTPALLKDIYIDSFSTNFEREKLSGKFGFKGNYLTELWQIVSHVQSKNGITATGLATQSVLYADAELFATMPEAEGNATMYTLTNEALRIAKNKKFKTPVELLDNILSNVAKRAKEITGKENIDTNFIYNSLVSVDNAAWLLYARENAFKNFDEMIPAAFKKALSYKHNKVALIFLATYNIPVADIQKAVDDGYFVIKIKTGQAGTQEEMLTKDIQRLTEVHNALKNKKSKSTSKGTIYYSMDANGRYEKKETLQRYLNHAKKIGAFDRILVYEEPLAASNNEYVGDLGIIIGADETVHTEADALRRIKQGYKVMVLKGIAKTLSQSMKIAKIAYENKVSCMCADLTVNPILVDWHKNLAARLQPFPKINMGLMETNGNINYKNWNELTNYHPLAGASWTKFKNGTFELDKNFYETSGGIFLESAHYNNLINL